MPHSMHAIVSACIDMAKRISSIQPGCPLTEIPGFSINPLSFWHDFIFPCIAANCDREASSFDCRDPPHFAEVSHGTTFDRLTLSTSHLFALRVLRWERSGERCHPLQRNDRRATLFAEHERQCVESGAFQYDMSPSRCWQRRFHEYVQSNPVAHVQVNPTVTIGSFASH